MLARSIKKKKSKSFKENKSKRFKKRKIIKKYKRNKTKKNKSKRNNLKNKTYRKKQTGGGGDDDDDEVNDAPPLGPYETVAIGTTGLAHSVGGPIAGAATGLAFLGAKPAIDQVSNNILCECRGWHFLNSGYPGVEGDFKCTGCLPKTGLLGLFSGERPTPGCPDGNSCCRGRLQGILLPKLVLNPEEKPVYDEGRPIYLCSECKHSRDEIRAKIRVNKQAQEIIEARTLKRVSCAPKKVRFSKEKADGQLIKKFGLWIPAPPPGPTQAERAQHGEELFYD